MRGLSLAFAGWVALGIAGVASAQSTSERVRELLLRSVTQTPTRHVVAIVEVHGIGDDDARQQVKVVASAEGQMRRTVLQPLRMQGVESVDDGQKTSTYIPDRRTVYVSASMRRGREEAMERVSLAMRNYRMRLRAGESVAGRDTLVLVAIPRTKDLDVRRMTFDAQSGFLLRMETIPWGKAPVVRFETLSVSYPTRLEGETFEMRPLGGVKTVRRDERPRRSVDPAVQARLGMVPAVPGRLPYGFIVRSIESVDSKTGCVAIRISDGLVRGTVYQTRRDDLDLRLRNVSMVQVGNRRILLAMDAPQAARERILEAFSSTVRQQSGSQTALSPSFPWCRVDDAGAWDLRVRPAELCDRSEAFAILSVRGRGVRGSFGA